MPDNKAVQPPIIIRKKVVHGGHHGGAWKVAYADFVTAMMALFIVLWLLSSSDQVKKAVAGYFLDPTGKNKNVGSGLVGTGESMALSKQDLLKLKEKLEQALRQAPDFEKLKDHITLTVSGEGLRIELSETSHGVFFELGNARPTQVAIEAMSILAAELGKLPNTLLVEGHTDATPYQQSANYSNWELSSDRANEARRIIREHGIRADQVKQVRGFADQSLRDPVHPLDAKNRRISFIVQYQLSQIQAASAEPHDSKEVAAAKTASNQKQLPGGKPAPSEPVKKKAS